MEGMPFTPVVEISGSSFRMGAASFGGAVYYGFPSAGKMTQSSSIQGLTLIVSNSSFSYNNAQQSGAAIYLDNLNYYDL